MKRRLWALVVSVFLVMQPSAVSAEIVNIDSATNNYRATLGLYPLATRSELTSLARIRAQQASVNFAHPLSYQWMFDYIPGCERAIGENLAYYTAGAEPAGWPVSAWIVSPSHETNMRRAWTWQGSAVITVSGKTFAVQVFAQACSSTTPAPQPPIIPEIPDTSMSP